MYVGDASNFNVQPVLTKRPPDAAQPATGDEPSNQTASPGHACTASRFSAGMMTDSWYVPARSTMVAPEVARATAPFSVCNGAAAVPAAALLPVGDTMIAPAGTPYCAAPTVVPASPDVPPGVTGGFGRPGGVGGGAGCERNVQVKFRTHLRPVLGAAVFKTHPSPDCREKLSFPYMTWIRDAYGTAGGAPGFRIGLQ